MKNILFIHSTSASPTLTWFRVEGIAMSTKDVKKQLASRSNGPRGSWPRSHETR